MTEFEFYDQTINAINVNDKNLAKILTNKNFQPDFTHVVGGLDQLHRDLEVMTKSVNGLLNHLVDFKDRFKDCMRWTSTDGYTVVVYNMHNP